MKRSILSVVVLGAFLLAVGTAVADSETFTGEYVAEGFGSGDLKAVFTATGRDTWDVAFHFRFDGQRHVYRGTAEGSLGGGRLEGQVRTENGRRTFSFEGSFSQGWFRGTHYEVKRGRSHKTGTLTLRR